MAKLNWNDCTVNTQSAVFGWADEAALSIHEGEYISSRSYSGSGYLIPGRPWTQVALDEQDPLTLFVENFDGNFPSAFAAMADGLNQAFKDAIESPIYTWDRFTSRRNGELVGSPRNIVDTGSLRDSQYLALWEE